MRMGLAAALAAVLFLVSGAGASPTLNFTGGPSGFTLSNAGVLSFTNGVIQDTDAALLGDIIEIGPLTINPTPTIPFAGLDIYSVTPASVAFEILSGATPLLTATLATNSLSTYDGGPLVLIFNGTPSNLTGISLTTAGQAVPTLVSLQAAGSDGVTLTLDQNIESQLASGTAVSGDLSGSVVGTSTPEPATLALTGLGLMALFIRRKK
jgi:hypothetical protein